MSRLLLALLAASLFGVAGCSGPATFAATDLDETVQSTSAPGIRIEATVRGGGDTLAIHAVAHNVGPHEWLVPKSCTAEHARADAWSVAARGRQDWDRPLPIYPREGCSQVLLGPFRPGDSVEADYTWDGSYVFDDGLAHAHPGSYDLEVVLEAYEPGTNHPRPTVVRFAVEVLA